MPKFNDSKGRTWAVKLDAPTIRAVRTTFDGLDLASRDCTTYDKLANDPVLLVDVLYTICEKQATAAGVSDVDFGEALVGDAIDHACSALLEGLLDFLPQRTRALLTAIAKKNEKIRDHAIARAMEAINNPDLERRAMEKLDEALDSESLRTLTQLLSVTSTPDS